MKNFRNVIKNKGHYLNDVYLKQTISTYLFYHLKLIYYIFRL